MDQFSLAMWLVQRKLLGIDPPLTLTPEMIPPSNRTITASVTAQVRILIINLFNYYYIVMLFFVNYN